MEADGDIEWPKGSTPFYPGTGSLLLKHQAAGRVRRTFATAFLPALAGNNRGYLKNWVGTERARPN
jgi:hypothetical protein